MKKRADGRYQKKVCVGYTESGKRKIKYVYGDTQKEVLRKEREILLSIDNGKYVDSSSITLEEWAKQWIDVYKSTVEYNTKEMYLNSMNRYIIPYLGKTKIQTIQPIQIQSLINDILAEGKTRSAEICQLTIKQIFNQAVRNRIISINPAEYLSPIKCKYKEKRALTHIEKESIKNAVLEKKERIFIDIMRYAGLRKGEALAITKQDIDVSERTISVNKSIYFKGNNPNLKDPKSHRNRVIPIPNILYGELIDYMNSIHENSLFTMKNGQLISKSSFRRFWENIIEKLSKVSCLNYNQEVYFTPHTCRHTYATDLYYAEVDVKTAQYLLGHSTLKITLEIYTHLDEKRTTKNIQKLDDYLCLAQ